MRLGLSIPVNQICALLKKYTRGRSTVWDMDVCVVLFSLCSSMQQTFHESLCMKPLEISLQTPDQNPPVFYTRTAVKLPQTLSVFEALSPYAYPHLLGLN